MTEVIVGMGEVGLALAQVLDVAHTRDIEPGDPIDADVLHVAFPWSDGFVDACLDYESEYNAGLVVVHSTVPVGTCDPHGWVHSPVRGRHPHLAESLRVFTKHAGGARAAEFVWPFELQIHDRAAETEAGKLWELVQFGLQVRITQAIYEWSAAGGLDPDVVYRQFAETYNAGCERVAPQFVRPVLDYVPGPIGGHCVAQNSRLIDHPLIDLI
jgi:hypothetical protein